MANLKFGPEGLVNETPMWAKWMFRIVALITTAAAFVVAGDPGIPDPIKVRVLLYLKGFDMLILGFSKLFGMQPEEKTEEQPN